MDMNMADLRAAAIADVRKRFQAGTLSWKDVGSLIEPFPAKGEMDTIVEGQEGEDLSLIHI
eukprot:9862529-Prorocentrum_lima.AAC.1